MFNLCKIIDLLLKKFLEIDKLKAMANTIRSGLANVLPLQKGYDARRFTFIKNPTSGDEQEDRRRLVALQEGVKASSSQLKCDSTPTEFANLNGEISGLTTGEKIHLAETYMFIAHDVLDNVLEELAANNKNRMKKPPDLVDVQLNVDAALLFASFATKVFRDELPVSNVSSETSLGQVVSDVVNPANDFLEVSNNLSDYILNHREQQLLSLSFAYGLVSIAPGEKSLDVLQRVVGESVKHDQELLDEHGKSYEDKVKALLDQTSKHSEALSILEVDSVKEAQFVIKEEVFKNRDIDDLSKEELVDLARTYFALSQFLLLYIRQKNERLILGRATENPGKTQMDNLSFLCYANEHSVAAQYLLYKALEKKD